MKTKRNRARAGTAKLTPRPKMRAPKSPTLVRRAISAATAPIRPTRRGPAAQGSRSISISTSRPAANIVCLEGDAASEQMLTDIGFPSYQNTRSPMVKSAFEYGPRVGCWRLLRIFRRFDIKVSILGVVRGLQQYPQLTEAFVTDGHEIVSHGWRWLRLPTR